MSNLQLNQVVPNFTCNVTSDNQISIKDLRGKKVVLYFYPKDDTPGCTIESIEFNGLLEQFSEMNTLIFGISRDNLVSHEKFKQKYNFSFELISDENESVCNLFGVIKEKNLYGRKYLGIERSTFLIDEEGKLIAEWWKVKAKGHAQSVLDYISAL